MHTYLTFPSPLTDEGYAALGGFIAAMGTDTLVTRLPRRYRAEEARYRRANPDAPAREVQIEIELITAELARRGVDNV